MPIAVDAQGNALFLDRDGQWKPAQKAVNPQTGESLAFDGAQWTPIGGGHVDGGAGPGGPPPAEADIAPQDRGYLAGLTQQLRQGASIGIADEVGAAGAGTGAALVAALRGRNPIDAASSAYDRRLGEIRRAEQYFRSEHPVASTMAQLGGGLALAGPAAKVVSQSPSILSAIGRGAGTGAAFGGASGFGSGEGGLANRLGSAAIGAGVGGVIGGAIPAAGWAVGKGAQTVRNMVGLQDPKKQAVMLVSRALDRDGIVGPIENSISMGTTKPVALADLGGQNVKRLADQVNVQGGTGANKIATFLTERQAEQPARIAGDIKGILSPSTDVYGLSDDLAAQARAAAAPLYEKAYGAGKAVPDEVWSDDIARMIDRPSMRQALGRAYRIAAEEGRDPRTLGLDFNEAGDVVFRDKVPTMQTLDYVKRGLDDVLEGFRDKVTGRLVLDESGRAINATRAAFREELKRLNPDYAAALKAYAGPTQQREAINLGRDFMGLDPEQISKQVSRMSPDEVQAFRAGAARRIQDTIDRVRGAGDATKRIFNDARVKGQIRAAFGDDAFKAFEKAMTAERSMFDTGAFVAGNSRTAQRLADSGDAFQEVTENFLRGGKGGVVRGLIESGISRGRGINDATGAELADMLTQTTPEARARVIDAIMKQNTASQKTQQNLLSAGAIANLLAAQQAGSGLAIRK